MWIIFVIFILASMSVLVLAHWLVYRAFVKFWPIKNKTALLLARVLLCLLPASFVVGSWLTRVYPSRLTSYLYYCCSAWLGLLNYLVMSAIIVWSFYFLLRPLRHKISWRLAWRLFSSLALLVFVYGLINASNIRVSSYEVDLDTELREWQGQSLVWVSDLHLGAIHGADFANQILDQINAINPAMVVFGGDLFDNHGQLLQLAAPLARLQARWGTYFITGNHEEFTNHNDFIVAAIKLGMKPLTNNTVSIKGINFIGVGFNIGSSQALLGSVLLNSNIDKTKNYVLLNHYPGNLRVAQSSGIDLQISGHSHGGQFWPYNHITDLVYRGFDYGQHYFKTMQVISSSGAGTWGPPIRVGANPEIVVIKFK